MRLLSTSMKRCSNGYSLAGSQSTAATLWLLLASCFSTETGLIGSRWLPGDYVGQDHGKPSVELGDPLSNSKGGGIGPAASVDLPIEIGNVSFHRVDGQREAMCDLGIRLALRDEAKDIELARSEPVRVPLLWHGRPLPPPVRTAFDNEAGDRADDLVDVLEAQGWRPAGKQAEMTVRQRRSELLRDRSRDLLDVGAVKDERRRRHRGQIV